MKIKLNKQDENEFYNLLDTKENNKDIASFYLELIDSENVFLDEEEIENLKNKQTTYKELLYKRAYVDDDDFESKSFLDSYGFDSIKKLEVTDYINNSFVKNISFEKIKYNDIKLNYNIYEKFEGFIFADIVVDEKYFKEIPQYGYFDQQYKYITVSKNNTVWMSTIPHEINTMKDDINKVKGNIAIFGLGLGYFAYMCSIKSDVSKITIIEKDDNIINVFEKFILPQFENKTKINIVKTDAFAYLNSIDNLKEFDYLYFDLWHDANDGVVLYNKILKYQKKCSSAGFLYWIEKTLISLNRRYFLTFFYESFVNEFIAHNEYNDFGKKFEKQLMNYFKDTTITSYEELHELLTDSSIKNIISNL